MELQSRPVKFSELVAFVDRKARIATNPIFGKISENSKISSDSQLVAGSKQSRPKSFSTHFLAVKVPRESQVPVIVLSHQMKYLTCAFTATIATPWQIPGAHSVFVDEQTMFWMLVQQKRCEILP